MAGEWGTVVQPSVKVTALRSDWSTVTVCWERAPTKRDNKQKKAVTCTVAIGKGDQLWGKKEVENWIRGKRDFYSNSWLPE